MTLEKRARRHCRLTSLAILALAVGGLLLPSGSSAALPGANGRIAYDSNQARAAPISRSCPRLKWKRFASAHQQLRRRQAAGLVAGRQQARRAHFNSTTNHFEIWTMNANGSGQAALVTAAVDLTNPTWSRTVFGILPSSTRPRQRTTTSIGPTRAA